MLTAIECQHLAVIEAAREDEEETVGDLLGIGAALRGRRCRVARNDASVSPAGARVGPGSDGIDAMSGASDCASVRVALQSADLLSV